MNARPNLDEVLAGYEGIRAGQEAFYKDLHQHPELSHHEHRTAQRVAGQLQECGFTVQTGIGGTGVVGVLSNGAGPTVLLRAELDALPIRKTPAWTTRARRRARGVTTPAARHAHAGSHALAGYGVTHPVPPRNRAAPGRVDGPLAHPPPTALSQHLLPARWASHRSRRGRHRRVGRPRILNYRGARRHDHRPAADRRVPRGHAQGEIAIAAAASVGTRGTSCPTRVLQLNSLSQPTASRAHPGRPPNARPRSPKPTSRPSLGVPHNDHATTTGWRPVAAFGTASNCPASRQRILPPSRAP